MRNFNRDSRNSGGRNFGGKGDFGRNRATRPQMYDAICSNCGKNCQVPFRPTGEKPVYCKDCFIKMGGKESPRNNRSYSRSDRPAFSPQGVTKEDVQLLNEKLDKILSLLEKSSQE